MQYFVDSEGRFIGGFDGVEMPAEARKATSAPEHPEDRWDGENWIPNLDARRRTLREALIKDASKARAALAQQADAYQLASWSDKARRAERVLIGNATAADLALLEHEAQRRGKGENAEMLAHKQNARAQALANALVNIDGLESAVLDQLARLSSMEGLDALRQDFECQLKKVALADIVLPPLDGLRAEAHRHIVGFYPEWQQLNVLRNAGRKEIARMNRFIESCRAWSDKPNADPAALAAIQP